MSTKKKKGFPWFWVGIGCMIWLGAIPLLWFLVINRTQQQPEAVAVAPVTHPEATQPEPTPKSFKLPQFNLPSFKVSRKAPEDEPKTVDPPEDKPKDKVDPPTPEPKNTEPEPIPMPVPVLSAIPDAKALASAEKTLRDTFKADYAKKDAALAASLLQLGQDTKDDPAMRFVAFREARDLAARGGDLALAGKAVAAIVALYKVDALQLHLDALNQTVNADPKTVVPGALLLASDLESADNYDGALRILRLTESIAFKSRIPALLKTVKDRIAETETAKKDFERVAKALMALEKAPNDPEANLVMGRHYMGKDWDKALPMLAKGSDRALKTLAVSDLALPTEAVKQVELADGWWDLGQKAVGKHKTYLVGRAQFWYKEALPGLTGITRARVEKRMAPKEDEPVVVKPPPPPTLKQFEGKWVLSYANNATRVYVIDAIGRVQFENKIGMLTKVKSDILLDLGDNKIERVSLKDGKLFIEHFSPASTYPIKAETTAVGTKGK